jgi:pimeloyl-ACP methyl ester carboxylesterase
VVRFSVADGHIDADVLGSGPPVILLHGWTLDRRIWTPQLKRLSERHQLISLDRRGFGRSTAPPDLAREIDDLLTIADACGATRFAVVAMSQGVRIALALAARAPKRVCALVLQGAPSFSAKLIEPETEAPPVEAFRTLAAKGDMGTLREQWGKHPLTQVHTREAKSILTEILADYQARDLLETGNRLEISAEQLQAIKAPALVLTGAYEAPVRRASSDVLAGSMLMNGERAVIAGGGHLCNLCNPTAFNEAVADFLERTRCSPPDGVTSDQAKDR